MFIQGNFMLHQQASVSSLVTDTYFVRKIYATEKLITDKSKLRTVNKRAAWGTLTANQRFAQTGLTGTNRADKLQISACKAAKSPTGAAKSAAVDAGFCSSRP